MTIITISFNETKRLQDILTLYGKSELAWVTAEFAPFSSAMKPDILFVPTSGPYAGRFILFEVNRKFSFVPRNPIDFFVERVQFAEEYLELKISKFVILSAQGIDELLKRRLAKRSVVFIDVPSNVEDFIESIRHEALL